MVFYHLDEASEILEKVKGNPLSIPERKKKAIDLASLMLQEAWRTISAREKGAQRRILRWICDGQSKAAAFALADQSFRSNRNRRIADQIIYLLHGIGVPECLSWWQKIEVNSFKILGAQVMQFFVPMVIGIMRKELSRVLLPSGEAFFYKYLQECKAKGFRLDFNHLGEQVLSGAEVKHRMQMYLEDLKHPEIESISIQISTLCSQIVLTDFDATVMLLAERLKELYRGALQYAVLQPDGTQKPKEIFLNMEGYKKLSRTLSFLKLLAASHCKRICPNHMNCKKS
jgi:RHH-type proline utilization regulon transcriptional repressor/proline dehydrogenase/delta 1-pyrroline-5-carboxylate dehydrogenase